MPVPPWIEEVYARTPRWVRSLGYLARTRPGHFYSPYPNLREVEHRASAIWGPLVSVPGIEMRDHEQWALLAELGALASELPFVAAGEVPQPGVRYRAENRPYVLGDALVLGAMLRQSRPRRYVEVGSGWSTAVALDTRDHFDLNFELTAIDPYPDRMLEAIGGAPGDGFELMREAVQDTDLGIFDRLEPGDIVVIDSTHVAKPGSDVNHLVFNVLPRLAPGVLVHVHDIFDGFEYPRKWVQERRCWSESYLMRAFLQFNSAYEMTLFTAWLHARDPKRYFQLLPGAIENPGAQLWITRVG